MSEQRQRVRDGQRWVIKVGSALLTNNGRGLATAAIADWVEQIAALVRAGREVVLVSSGSVAEGMSRLGWQQRPSAIYELQAAAAVGQMGLVQSYESAFQRYDLRTAQILLVHDDLSNRRRYLNARNTLQTLLQMDAVPIVNENDTVATEEIQFGDNDTLAALVANLIDADALIILTDQDGMFDSDPRTNPDASLIAEARADDERLQAMAGGSAGALGRGGMITKVLAAQRAARSGTSTVIVGGRQEQVLNRIARGETLGTLLYSDDKPMAARKQWLAGHLRSRGRLHLDKGAADVVRRSGKSLLPVGVAAVDGRFQRGELVTCVGPDGTEVARGLVNYSATEARQIRGLSSLRLAEVLGYEGDPELIHRDNMVVL